MSLNTHRESGEVNKEKSGMKQNQRLIKLLNNILMDENIESVKYGNVRFVPRNCYSPNHDFVKSWVFGFDKGNESDELRALKEANLADAMARVGALNGISRNDMQHLFPAVLRMLKSQSDWTK